MVIVLLISRLFYLIDNIFVLVRYVAGQVIMTIFITF